MDTEAGEFCSVAIRELGLSSARQDAWLGGSFELTRASRLLLPSRRAIVSLLRRAYNSRGCFQ